MSERLEIRLAGLGGQGVILAGVILGRAAVLAGREAAGSNSYGAQARGSACQAEVVISPRSIDYPHVEEPAWLVAMSQGAYDTFAPGVHPRGTILYDRDLVQPAGQRRELGFKVTALALDRLQSKQVANVVWVGVLCGAAHLFERRVLEQAVEQSVPPRFLELNRRALALGLELGRESEADHGR